MEQQMKYITAESDFQLIYAARKSCSIDLSGKQVQLDLRDIALVPPHNKVKCSLESSGMCAIGCDAYKIPSQLISMLPQKHPVVNMFHNIFGNKYCLFKFRTEALFSENIHGFFCNFGYSDSHCFEIRSDSYYAQSTFMLLLQLILNDYEDYSILPIQGIKSSLVINLMHYLNLNYKTATLTDAAEQLQRTPEYLSRLTRKITGRNFTDILTEIRLRNAAIMLSTTSFDESDIANSTGYSNQRYFRIAFIKKYGMTPLRYRKLNTTAQGENIR